MPVFISSWQVCKTELFIAKQAMDERMLAEELPSKILATVLGGEEALP